MAKTGARSPPRTENKWSAYALAIPVSQFTKMGKKSSSFICISASRAWSMASRGVISPPWITRTTRDLPESMSARTISSMWTSRSPPFRGLGRSSTLTGISRPSGSMLIMCEYWADVTSMRDAQPTVRVRARQQVNSRSMAPASFGPSLSSKRMTSTGGVRHPKTAASRAPAQLVAREVVNATAGGATVRPGANSGLDDELGQEFDVIVTYRTSANFTFQLGWAHFFAGDFLSDTKTARGGDDDTDFFYVQALVHF